MADRGRDAVVKILLLSPLANAAVATARCVAEDHRRRLRAPLYVRAAAAADDGGERRDVMRVVRHARLAVIARLAPRHPVACRSERAHAQRRGGIGGRHSRRFFRVRAAGGGTCAQRRRRARWRPDKEVLVDATEVLA